MNSQFSHPHFGSPTSPPHNRFRDHSPTKSSPLRHTLSTLSNHSDTDASSLPSRHGTISSNASSAYSQQSTGNLSGYDSAADPFVTKPGQKRDRSESPVKKNVAFAKWEAREKSEQVDPETTPKPVRTGGRRDAAAMDVSPRKVRDDDWRSSLGRSESRPALSAVQPNTLPEPSRHNRTKSHDVLSYSPSTRQPAASPPPPAPTSSKSPSHGHSRGYSVDSASFPNDPVPMISPHNTLNRNSLATLSRSDSMRASRPGQIGHIRFGSTDVSAPHLDDDDLAKLQNSSTPQLRHLSKIAADGNEDLSVHTPEEQVVGMAGRRKLQKSGAVHAPQQKTQSSFGSQWQSTRWMDTQRKHLQAYEYLCHIGEARAWLEDVLDPAKLPPIVQLEEALRDGVTFAEVVNRLATELTPDQQRMLGSLRIFRSPRLQFRHSDNIALFFRFLGSVELPELFRFELVDLYEKKNIPKVIYCIHALSWLLFRKGVTSFTITHLVGQLEFTGEELEETQKGIDRSGVKMPDFSGMRKELDIPEPPPPPEPSSEELLLAHEASIEDMQSQMKGALVRMRLGNVMQDLWDSEEIITLFQARIRGGFAREIFDFRYTMDLSTRRIQAAAKGMLVRTAQRQRQHTWRSREGQQQITKIQSLWRGKQQRVETQRIQTQLRAQKHGLKGLQAAIRGALGRWKTSDTWEETRDQQTEAAVQELQAAARGALERIELSDIMNKLWGVEDSICHLQAVIRGSQIRGQARTQRKEARQATVDVARLQAAARGSIERRRQHLEHSEREMHQPAITDVQAAARGLLTRLRQARAKGALQGRQGNIIKAQALLRAHLAKAATQKQRSQLAEHTAPFAIIQAVARASITRKQCADLRKQLQGCSDQVVLLQSLSRAMLERRNIGVQLGDLETEEDKITTLQALSRAYMLRQRVFEQLVAMEKEDDSISQLQALARALLTRAHVGASLSELEAEEAAIVELQTAVRAFTVRARFEEKKEHYRENMKKVVKLQSFVRAKQQGKSYESLMKGANPPLPVVRRHLHLLTDSHLEFEGELEAERLRRLVVERVREVEQVEGYVEGLDVKVGLLVKNKISLDEVVKHQKHFGGSASQLLRSGGMLRQTAGGIDLKALNKSSRKKLGGYEELFFLLQTQPTYLARLFFQLSSKGVAEKDGKNLERLVLTLFGYAHKSREEYFFLRLLVTAAQQVVTSARNLDEYFRLQSASFHQRLFLGHVRSPIHRSYLKQLMGAMVRDGICGQDHLDLESDPLQIHLSIINNEELNTGQPSRRPRDLPRETVIRDPDVRGRYVEHLQDLRDLCDGFFLSLEETTHRMPYGVRYFAASLFQSMQQQYPHEDPAHLAILTGAWLWKSYLLPAFREPEMWGVIDRGLSPVHKRNLAQVTLVLGQVCAAGRLFGQDNLYLQPLNNWVSEALGRWQDALHHLFDMESPEEQFDADQFSDLNARTKPTVYIKLSDILQLHSLVADNIQAIAPTRDDPIKELLSDLGSPKGNESDFGGAGGGEMTLTLKSRFKVQEDPNAEARALFVATKRLVLFIIRVQSGSNLMEILLRPISHDDDDLWMSLIQEEMAEKHAKERNRNPRRAHQQGAFDPRASMRGGRTLSVYSETPSALSEDMRMNNVLDLEGMTYAELKSQALENILALENPSTPPQYRVSRQNNYQEILNALAADIRSKHRRRLERQREIDATRQTLSGLDKKAEYLEEQLTSYNDYIEQCLHTLANKKTGSKGFRLPFTKQWNHERELEKAGRQPKFGSYKYSARQLADKGVLLQWPAYPPENWNQLNVVISSDEVGVFHLEASAGSMILPGASAKLLLDDLLQAQYDNTNSIGVFEEAGQGGGAKLAVNLLLHLVFKKFYRDA